MAGSENSGPGTTGTGTGSLYTQSGQLTPEQLASLTGNNPAGSSGYTNTSKNVNISVTPKETAYTQLDRDMIATFGRRATAKEKSAYFKALNAAEKKYSTRSKGRQVGGPGGSRSSDKTNTYQFDATAFRYEFVVGLASAYVKSGQELGGLAGETIADFKAYAADMGIALNDATAVSDALKTIKGEGDAASIKQSYRDRAISMYGSLADQLKADPKLTVRTAAADYIDVMATMLDLNPATITLSDNTLQKALNSSKDNKPYKKNRSEFMMDLRGDTRFATSTFAKQEARNLASSLGKAFGFGA